MKPLKDYVLVAELKNKEDENKSEGGIILTTEDNSRASTAMVVGIGPDVTTVALEQTVYPDWNKGKIVKIQGSEFVVLKEEDLFGVA
jgi:co-chaperonin GroES (HSP10)